MTSGDVVEPGRTKSDDNNKKSRTPRLRERKGDFMKNIAGLLITTVLVGVSSIPCKADKQGTALPEAAHAGIMKGVEFLVSRQGNDGNWLQNPAVTALAANAVMNSPVAEKPKFRRAVNLGLDYAKGYCHPDGSIWNRDTEQYPNYSTAISLTVLALRNRPSDREVIRKAREFLLNSQFSDSAEDGRSYGGIGYGKKLRPDMSNTQWALEALYITDYLDREPFTDDPEKGEKADLAWKRAINFLTQCQNLAETNKQAWVVTDPDNRGGFIYMPGESKAGEIKSETTLGLRSYGSMTYAGLKSMIYAKLTRNDERVQAAMGWIKRHFTFTENPNLGAEGHLYYLHTCAKTLAVYGDDRIMDAGGKSRDWRKELTDQLLGMQRDDGSWANTNGRWMESIPELATAYAVRALEIIHGDRLTE